MVRQGLVRPKPDSCENPTCPVRWRNLPIELHHEDYSNPAAVQYLCGFCHGWADNAIRDETEHRGDSQVVMLTAEEKEAFADMVNELGMSPRCVMLATINSSDIQDSIRSYWLAQIPLLQDAAKKCPA